MINFKSARFVISAPTYNLAPEKKMPEILVVGKSNVGKSSLLNALCENRNLAFTSSKPGHTRLLNFYDVEGKFYLVDAPGYGYSAAGKGHLEKFSEMMEGYFGVPNLLKGVLYLLDSRHAPTQDDKDFYDFVKQNHIPMVLVMTKVDKLNQSEKAKIPANLKAAFGEALAINPLLTSAEEGIGLDKLRAQIDSFLRNS